MGAYTWTFVRIDKLTPEMAKTCVAHAKWLAEGSTYGDYEKMTWKSALNKWLKMHEEDYDYFVNECGVPPEKMTKEYLTKKLKEKMENHKLKMECYDKCLKGEMSVEEMLHKTKQLKQNLGDTYVIKRNNHYFIHIQNEIFRNYEYSADEFHTVEDLINHCREQKGKQFIDFNKDYDDYHEWNNEIEQHVRDFYEKIGDDNFYVHFG